MDKGHLRPQKLLQNQYHFFPVWKCLFSSLKSAMLCKNGKTSYKTTHNIKLIHLHFGFHNYADISHQTYHSSLKETFSKSWEDFHSSVRSKLSVLRNYTFFLCPQFFHRGVESLAELLVRRAPSVVNIT